MKSKAHFRKCQELGVDAMKTLEDVEIDADALEKQRAVDVALKKAEGMEEEEEEEDEEVAGVVVYRQLFI